MSNYLIDHTNVPVVWLLEALSLSKNGWYHQEQEKKPEIELKEKIESVLVESPYYGYKRVTKELHNRGDYVNHKKVYKIMGEYYLLQVRKKKGIPRTTNSNHNLLVYPNEIKYLGPVIPGWVWVADITYIPTNEGWCYLALIMDIGSRKIVGWSLSRSLHRSVCIDALTMALQSNNPPKYHHSDRGVQYCSYDYIKLLKQHNITPSMADTGVSVDNNYAESLNRSVKVEEVYMNHYETYFDAQEGLGNYIHQYNTKRLHSSLGYVSPVRFEATYQLTVAKS